MSHFDQIPELPPDPIFGLAVEFKQDPRPHKFTLVTGYYQNEELVTPVLESVAEAELTRAQKHPKREYLPIDGDAEFVQELGKFVFGSHYDEERICGVQTVGGTGALYLSGMLAKQWTDQIAISDPTWSNHWRIFKHAELTTVPYPYYAHKELLFDQCMQTLSGLPEGSCVLLHTNCHNTSSFDLTHEQWEQLSGLIAKKRLFPILDMAYQGFSAPPEEDAYAVRLFMEKGLEMALTYTAAKNFSIYSERVGGLFVVADSGKKVPAIRSQIKAVIRASYSNPPIHGVAIVKTILKTPALKAKWLKELETMRLRMKSIRKAFVEKMTKHEPDGGWDAILRGNGLFCYSELKKDEIMRLKKEYGYYIAADGRINLTGLNHQNLDPFIQALVKVK